MLEKLTISRNTKSLIFSNHKMPFTFPKDFIAGMTKFEHINQYYSVFFSHCKIYKHWWRLLIESKFIIIISHTKTILIKYFRIKKETHWQINKPPNIYVSSVVHFLHTFLQIHLISSHSSVLVYHGYVNVHISPWWVGPQVNIYITTIHSNSIIKSLWFAQFSVDHHSYLCSIVAVARIWTMMNHWSIQTQIKSMNSSFILLLNLPILCFSFTQWALITSVFKLNEIFNEI